MAENKVSVIIPVYKAERYIARCVRSLFEQTLADIEYIFVDDNSPDESISIIKKILQEYPHRSRATKFIHHDTNRGVAAARNTGIQNASGRYIAYCDSDDWVELNMYESLYNTAITENAEMVACDISMDFANGKSHVCPALEPSIKKTDLLRTYLTSGWAVCANVLASNELYAKFAIRACEGYNFSEDYFISMQLLMHANKYVKVGCALYHYERNNADSLVHESNSPLRKVKTADSQVFYHQQIVNLFNTYKIYTACKRELSWRMLSAKRGWFYDSSRWKEYRALMPDANQYIWSNPLCSTKDKIYQTLILRRWTAPLIRVIQLIEKMIHKH